MGSVSVRTGQRLIIGVTGPPGAGKSSLVESITGLYRQRGERVGIVAVDPSSPFSGGAILGDRIRMQNHATDPHVFIRSMGTRGHLGGVSRATADALRIMEAGGYERLLIETVGVGQSELEIMQLVDTVVVVLNPGAGDGIQAIKAGIMEVADIFVVNKGDLPGAERLKNEIDLMLDMACDERSWRPPVIVASTYTNKGVDELVAEIEKHREYLVLSGKRELRRREQIEREVWRHLEDEAHAAFNAIWNNYRNQEQIWSQIDSYELARRIWLEITKGGIRHE